MLEMAPPLDVRTTRKFKRSAPLGMKVWRSLTINFDCMQLVEHIELECPGFVLTEQGPVLKEPEATE